MHYHSRNDEKKLHNIFLEDSLLKFKLLKLLGISSEWIFYIMTYESVMRNYLLDE
jgi:hypothetical protein